VEKLFAWFVMIAVPVGIVAAIVWPHVARRRFRAAFAAADSDLFVECTAPLVLRSRQAPQLRLRAYTGKRTTDMWGMTSETMLRLGAASTLGICREHDRPLFETLFSAEDFLVGDQAFDDEFHLEGNNVDALQQLFSHVEVRAAVRAVFTGLGVVRVRVDDRGQLSASFAYSLDVARVRATHAALQQLATVFEAHAPPPRVGPIKKRRVDDGVPAIAGSGAPVGFKPYRPS